MKEYIPEHERHARFFKRADSDIYMRYTSYDICDKSYMLMRESERENHSTELVGAFERRPHE